MNPDAAWGSDRPGPRPAVITGVSPRPRGEAFSNGADDGVPVEAGRVSRRASILMCSESRSAPRECPRASRLDTHSGRRMAAHTAMIATKTRELGCTIGKRKLP